MDTTLHYQASAFTKPQLEKFDQEAVAKADVTDLRMFTGCNYFLANESFSHFSLLYKYLKKNKAHGLVTPRYIEQLNNRYRHLSQGAFGSNGCIFGFLWMLGIFGGGGYTIIMFFGGLLLERPTTLSGFYQAMHDFSVLWLLALTFILITIGRIGSHRTKDRCGYEFHRDTGKVCLRNVQGEIAQEYDFKNFTPFASTDHVTTGGYEVNSNLVNLKDGFSVNLSKGGGFVQGVLAWNYILTFMDVTKPLPDIPEHEPTRHLDPVTKAYDEKTGRDPYYWRKKNVKEVREMEKQELEKAKAWVEERKALLKKKGFTNLKFLNSLLD